MLKQFNILKHIEATQVSPNQRWIYLYSSKSSFMLCVKIIEVSYCILARKQIHIFAKHIWILQAPVDFIAMTNHWMACPTFFLSAIKCQQAQKYASNINHFIDQCNERFGNDHFAAIWRLQSIKNYEFPKKFAILQIG